MGVDDMGDDLGSVFVSNHQLLAGKSEKAKGKRKAYYLHVSSDEDDGK